MTRLADSAAALALGAYVIGVGRAGNGRLLLDAIRADGPGFARWAGAGLLLTWIVGKLPPPADKLGMGILTIATVVIALDAGPNLLRDVSALFSGVINNGKSTVRVGDADRRTRNDLNAGPKSAPGSATRPGN